MSIWGKIIGGVGGFMVGGPLGAIIGGVAGHAVDKIREEREALGESEPEALGDDRGWGPGYPPGPGRRGPRLSAHARQTAFSVGIIVLGAKMAKADGHVTRAEIDAFKQVFRIAPGDVPTVAAIFDEAKRDPTGFEPYAAQIAAVLRGETQLLEDLLGGLFHIAKADGAITSAEIAFLRRVATIFGLSHLTFERVRLMFMEGRTGPDPYDVLGVTRSASDNEVKSTWRQLIRENHPDMLIARGLPEDAVALANEKMAAINAAYEAIERERGLK